MTTNLQQFHKRLAALQARYNAGQERLTHLVTIIVPYKNDEQVEPADNPKLEERDRGIIVVFYRIEDESESEAMDAKIEGLIDEYKRTHTQSR